MNIKKVVFHLMKTFLLFVSFFGGWEGREERARRRIETFWNEISIGERRVLLGMVEFSQGIYHLVLPPLPFSSHESHSSIFAVHRSLFGNKTLNNSRWTYFGTAVTWLVSKEGSSQTLKDYLLLPAVQQKLQWAVLESFQSRRFMHW